MPASRPRGPVDPSRAGVPSADEPLVAAASEVLGGPLGRHARLERTRWGGTGPRRRLLVLPARPIAAVLAIVAAVFVGLGANLDDPPAQIRAALSALEALPGTRVLRTSRLYRSRPRPIRAASTCVAM